MGYDSVEELEIAMDEMEGIAEDGGEFTDNLAREARVRSVYLDWCKEFGKEPDESRFPTFSENLLAMEEYAKEAGKSMNLNQYADCTEEQYAAAVAKAAAERDQKTREEDRKKAEAKAKKEEEKAKAEVKKQEEKAKMDEEKAKKEEERKKKEEAKAKAAAEAKAKADGTVLLCSELRCLSMGDLHYGCTMLSLSRLWFSLVKNVT